MCISFPILLFYPEIVKNERKPKDENITRHYISNPSIQPKSNESAKKNVLPSHAESPYLTNCIRIL